MPLLPVRGRRILVRKPHCPAAADSPELRIRRSDAGRRGCGPRAAARSAAHLALLVLAALRRRWYVWWAGRRSASSHGSTRMGGYMQPPSRKRPQGELKAEFERALEPGRDEKGRLDL